MSDLVLFHGVGLDRNMWQRCVSPLAARHQVRTLDLLGHGDAAPAPSGTTLAELAKDAARRLQGPAHIVGFSLGAMVAQQVAIEHPELVRSLVLVSSVAVRTPLESADVAERMELADRDFPAAVDATLERWMPESWRDSEPDLVHDLRRTLLGNDHDSYLRCYRVFATADQHLWQRLPEITAPTLAVTGSDDPGSTPEMTHRLAEAIPHARAVVIPRVRHLLPLQAPGQLTDHILTHTTEVDHDIAPAQALHQR